MYEEKINEIAHFLRKCHRWEDWWNSFEVFCTYAEIRLFKSAPDILKFLPYLGIINLNMSIRIHVIWRCEEEDMRVWSDDEIASLHLKKITKNRTPHEFQIRMYPQIQLSKRARVSLLRNLHCTAQQLEFPHFQIPEAFWGPHGPSGVNFSMQLWSSKSLRVDKSKLKIIELGFYYEVLNFNHFIYN